MTKMKAGEEFAARLRLYEEAAMTHREIAEFAGDLLEALRAHRSALAARSKRLSARMSGAAWPGASGSSGCPSTISSARRCSPPIQGAGQEPHWAYAAGNDRLSCTFCIMGSAKDIANGARHRPDLLAKYIEIEQRTGYTMHMSRKSLTELIEEAAA